MMRKRIAMIVAATALLGLVGGLAMATVVGGSSSPAAPIGHTMSGPCDEPEHADDPRCEGPQRAEDDVTATPEETAAAGPRPTATASPRDDDGPDDISGPCDEAEHANDPRCTGGETDDDDDRSGHSGRHSGPGSDDDDDRDGDDDDDDDDDRSGSNSGRH